MITVVVGPPCAGKSTYVSEHRKADDVVIDFDAIAKALGADTSHASTQAIREAAFAARSAVVESVLADPEHDSWIIHTLPPKGALSTYADAGATFVLLDPGMDECLSRSAKDERPEFTDQAIKDWYESPPQLPTTQPADKAGFLMPRGGPMKRKNFAVSIKAAGSADGLQDGQFTGYASVFGNVDSYGDVVVKGAFEKTLADWDASGNPIPLLWGHDMQDPFSNIGSVEASEDDHGLLVKGTFDLDNPKAAQVYRLVKGRRVGDMSFAFDVVSSSEAKADGVTVNELLELNLYETSIVPIGANQETEILAVKSNAEALVDGIKEGRVLATKHIDSLRKAQEAIGVVIAAAVGDDEPKASGTGPANAEELVRANAEEPSPIPSAKTLSAQIHIYSLTGERGSK